MRFGVQISKYYTIFAVIFILIIVAFIAVTALNLYSMTSEEQVKYSESDQEYYDIAVERNDSSFCQYIQDLELKTKCSQELTTSSLQSLLNNV